MMKSAVTMLLVLTLFSCARSEQKKEQVNDQKSEQIMDEPIDSTKLADLDTATFGAGCFWCVEAVFEDMKGVVKVQSGYAGGTTENPTYKEVCSGTTGHAEVARLWYDPKVISYETLLEIFWHAHDPTTLNRQGGDKGTQYRSVIFYHNEEQKKIAEESKAETDSSGLWSDPIVTHIQPVPEYYPAEDYHQNFFKNNPTQGYCRAVVGPKVQKVRKKYKHLLKSAEAHQ